MAVTHGITLQPYVQARHVAGSTEGFRWRIEAVSAREMPTAVFLYKKVATKLYAADTGGAEPPEEVAWAGEFNGVACAADLEDYPEGEPRPGDHPPFYRLDYVDQVFLSKTRALQAYEATLRAVDKLRETLDVLEDMQAKPTVHLGLPPSP